MDRDQLKPFLPYLIVFGMSLAIWAGGSIITHPSYARLGAFTFLVLGVSVLLLGHNEEEEVRKEGLKRNARKSSKPSGKALGKQKANQKKRKRKQPSVPKT